MEAFGGWIERPTFTGNAADVPLRNALQQCQRVNVRSRIFQKLLRNKSDAKILADTWDDLVGGGGFDVRTEGQIVSSEPFDIERICRRAIYKGDEWEFMQVFN